jgi:hypothetical protein
MALGSTQPLTEMSTWNLFRRGEGRLAGKADNLIAICELTVYRKCGSLAVSQPYGPSRPVTGISLPFFTSHLSLSSRGDLFTYGFPIKILHASSFGHAFYMPRPYNPSWLDHSSCILGRVQVMKHLFMQFSPVLLSPHPARSKYSPRRLSVYIILSMSQTKFQTHIKLQAILYISIFTFWKSNQEDKRFWTER